MGKSGQATENTLEQLKDIMDNSEIATPTTLDDGRKVVASAGTAEALGASTTIKEVIVTAELSNTGVISVGGSGVVAAESTREGTPLEPGESAVIEIDDLAKVYIDSTVNGDGVTYTTQV